MVSILNTLIGQNYLQCFHLQSKYINREKKPHRTRNTGRSKKCLYWKWSTWTQSLTISFYYLTWGGYSYSQMSHVHSTNSIKKYFLLVTLLIFYLERDNSISLIRNRSALEKLRPGLLMPLWIFLALGGCRWQKMGSLIVKKHFTAGYSLSKMMVWC